MSIAKRNINYLSKDFDTFREQLIEFSKNYFPDTYADFSATSPGMMFMEMAAYVGDILSFYQDIQVQETYLQYAKNPVNLYAIAYMMGYKPKVTSVSEADLTVTQKVPADVFGQPRWDLACRVAEYSSVKSDNGSNINFLLKDPVDFSYSSSYDPTDIEVSEVDLKNIPLSFNLIKHVKAISGEIKTYEKKVGSYQKYLTFEIPDDNIVGILDVIDSDGNKWVEVPCLGQDTVFVDETLKDGQGKQTVLLKLEKVPRRFVTRFTSKNKLQIQFGAGMYADDNDQKDFLPDPLTLEASVQELSQDKYDQAYDPSNFLFSKSYGLAPVNTTLTIRYIVGGGVESNVPANTITKQSEVYLSSKNGTVEIDPATVSFNNEAASSGGRDGDTVEEVRQNSLRSFAEQKRMVSLNDFNVRALSMPARYGSVAKVYATNESLETVNRTLLSQNPLAITLFVLSKDSNGNLTKASESTKNNLKTYLSNYLMVTDAIEIKDAFVINIGVQYDIVLRPNYRSKDVLLRCNEALRDYFSLDKRYINETINLSDVYTLLDGIQGVQTVKDVRIVNKQGLDRGYSEFGYDIDSAIQDRVLYPSYDPCIFEVKYPNVDIEGRVTAL